MTHDPLARRATRPSLSFASAPPSLKVGDKVHGLFVEEDEWYKAHVVAVRTDPGSGAVLYDIKYDGFPEEEAYDYDKPAEEVHGGRGS